MNPAFLAGRDRSIRRSQQRRTLTCSALDCIVGLLELATHAFVRHLAEIGMRPTMIGNFVTFPRSSRNDLRMFRDVFTDHEEGCLDVMRGQQIKQFWCQCRARSVVKGHRDVRTVDVDRVECDARFFRRRSILSCRSALCWCRFRAKSKGEA